MGDLISRKALVAALIEEREKFPHETEERYSLGVKLPNRFNQAMRGGIRKALRLVEIAPTVDAEPVRLRVEKVDIVESNGWYRKRFYCPCGMLIRTEAWDEKRCFGQGTILKENVMPNFCPNCGAKMDLEVQQND